MVDCHKGFSVDRVGVSSQLVDLLLKVVVLFSGARAASELFGHVERATDSFVGISFQLPETDRLIRLSDHHLFLLTTLHLLDSVRREQFRVSLKELGKNSASMLN